MFQAAGPWQIDRNTEPRLYKNVCPYEQYIYKPNKTNIFEYYRIAQL